MTTKSYLADALGAHNAGDEKRAIDVLLEGVNYYSRRLSSAYCGTLKQDLPIITLALKIHYLSNLEQCGDVGRELVKLLETGTTATCIHN